MRIAYWDCFAGIAGDMNLGAMVGCGLAVEALREDLAGLALEGFRIEHRGVQRGALAADKIDVVIAGHEGGHVHRGLADIREILAASSLPEGVAERADRVFEALCAAEAEVHGCGIDEVHLHEVGAIDAIVDIVGACCGMRRLGIEAIRCSPLNVGSGHVTTAHGTLPVPAPATALLLRQAPVYSRGPEAELVTPTGAALVAVLAEGFGPWPAMRVSAIGYGAGDNDFHDLANVVRLVVGESIDDSEQEGSTAGGVTVIETNLDDADPRILGALIPRLLDAGALDAFTTPVNMKKNRPGTQLTVIAPNAAVDALSDLVFRETTTLGLRIYPVQRRELARRHVEVNTPWGAVRVKVGRIGDEVVNASPEFEDCARLAAAAGVAVKRVIQAAVAAYASGTETEENDR
jgi:uncharacterized protein (TIGR00299 family) protein